MTAIDYFLPAMLAYIILQSGINYVAIGLADLRARKVLRRFRATPLRPAQILGAQITGGALTVVLQLLVLILGRAWSLFQAQDVRVVAGRRRADAARHRRRSSASASCSPAPRAPVRRRGACRPWSPSR